MTQAADTSAVGFDLLGQGQILHIEIIPATFDGCIINDQGLSCFSVILSLAVFVSTL